MNELQMFQDVQKKELPKLTCEKNDKLKNLNELL